MANPNHDEAGKFSSGLRGQIIEAMEQQKSSKIEAKLQSNGKYLAYVDGKPLRNSKGTCINFKHEAAAHEAAKIALKT